MPSEPCAKPRAFGWMTSRASSASANKRRPIWNMAKTPFSWERFCATWRSSVPACMPTSLTRRPCSSCSSSPAATRMRLSALRQRWTSLPRRFSLQGLLGHGGLGKDGGASKHRAGATAQAPQWLSIPSTARSWCTAMAAQRGRSRGRAGLGCRYGGPHSGREACPYRQGRRRVVARRCTAHPGQSTTPACCPGHAPYRDGRDAGAAEVVRELPSAAMGCMRPPPAHALGGSQKLWGVIGA